MQDKTQKGSAPNSSNWEAVARLLSRKHDRIDPQHALDLLPGLVGMLRPGSLAHQAVSSGTSPVSAQVPSHSVTLLPVGELAASCQYHRQQSRSFEPGRFREPLC